MSENSAGIVNRYIHSDRVTSVTITPASGRQITEETIAIAILVLFAVLAALISHLRLPAPGVFVVLLGFIPVIVNIATCVALVNMYRVPTLSRPLLYLAVVYAASAIFTTLITVDLSVAGDRNNGEFIGSRTLPWLVSLWQMYVGASAIAYVVLRFRERAPEAPTGRFVTGTLLINGAVVTACIVAASAFDRFTPPPALVGAMLSLLAFAMMFRLTKRTLIDLAFSLSLLSYALSMLLGIVYVQRYTGAWYIEQMLQIFSFVCVLVATGRTLSENRAKVLQMTEAIADSQKLLERNALRLNGLWYVASHGVGDDRSRYQALLDTATAALRPGSSTFGYISHTNGGVIEVDSTYGSALLPADCEKIERVYFSGAKIPFERSIESHLHSTERSAAWTDFAAVDSAGMAWEHLGWTRVIGSSLMVGDKKYFVVFGSMHEIFDDAFSEDDFTYVDVLAAFVAGRLLQEAQIERIRFQIEHDALTGLHTRTQFRLAIRKAISLGNPFAIATLDLDNFASLNAESGTMVADELLVEVASSIDGVDDSDVAARLGADEFGLLISHRQSEQRTQARLSEYFGLFGTSFSTGLTESVRRINVTASVGAASFPEDGRTEQELMQCAQIALAAAKNSGGNNVTLFSRSMESIVEQQRVLSREIRDALSGNQFVLEYQPTVSLATGRIHGAEALIRWDHPTRGRLLPGEFIPFAEGNGLSIDIGRWVLGRALHDIMSLDVLPSDFRCFINISAPGLEGDDFVSNIRSDMAPFPGAADRFGIEVTEGAAMLNAERAIIALGALRRLGLKIAIDDFGTGYSSLSYLKRLPIDSIKFDRSFITGIPHESSDVALTETLLTMASRFRLTSVAEGVETLAQAQWLGDHGCEYAQGFLFSKSLPIGELRTVLEEDQPFALNDTRHAMLFPFAAESKRHE